MNSKKSAKLIATSWIFVVLLVSSEAYELGPKRIYESMNVADFKEDLFSEIIGDRARIDTTFSFSSDDWGRSDRIKSDSEITKIIYVRFEQQCFSHAPKKCLTAIFRGSVSRANFQGIFLGGDLFTSNDAQYKFCKDCKYLHSISFLSENGDEDVIFFSRENVIFGGNLNTRIEWYMRFHDPRTFMNIEKKTKK
jgi:hypothetical protein